MADNGSMNISKEITSSKFPILLYEWTIAITFLFILCVTALVVNSFLLFVIWKDPMKCLRTRSTFLVTNLIIADFVGALANITRFSYRYLHDTFGDGEIQQEFEKPVVVSGYATLLVSCMTVLLISVEHLGVIASPFKFKILVTNGVIAWCIGLTWVFCSTLTIMLFTIPENHEVFHGITAMHGLLLVTLPTAYTFAYLSLKRQLKELSRMADSAARNVALKKQRTLQQQNFLVTSAGIVLSYLITCAPFTVHNYEQFAKDIHYNLYRNSDELGMIFFVILNLNLCTDPFIYCLRTPQYRSSCAAILCCSRTQI